MTGGLQAQLDRVLASNDKHRRSILVSVLTNAGIDPDGEIGQVVLNEFRPEFDRTSDLRETFCIDSVTEWLAERLL